MARLGGVIWGVQRDSFVYGILIGNRVYFGETGDIPPKRWSAHLSVEGTLSEKLGYIGTDIATYAGPIVFVSVCCDDLIIVDKALKKLARRAIEEELHRRFYLNPGAVHPDAELISSMPPAPVRITFPFDPRNAAIEAYELIVDEFAKAIQRMK